MCCISSSKGVCLIIVVLGFFLMSIHRSAIIKASQKGVTFEKVDERTYDKEIREIAYGLTGEDGNGSLYCKMIWFDEKELQFLNKTGGIITTDSLAEVEFPQEGKRSGKWVIFSNDGVFAAIQDYMATSGDAEDRIVSNHYTIYDEKGQKIYAVDGLVEGWEWEDQFIVSDRDGAAVGTRFIYGALDFYNPKGGIKTVSLFGEVGPRQGGPGYATFSLDGEYLAVVVEYVGKRPQIHSYDADEVWFMLFDRVGNERWRINTGETQIDMFAPEKLAISAHGKYILVKSLNVEPGEDKGQKKLNSLKFSLYDITGKEMSFNDMSLSTFRYFNFSPQERYVVLGGSNVIRVIKTEDGSTVFQKELPNNSSVREVCFSGDGQYVIVETKMSVGTKMIGQRATAVYNQRVLAFNLNGNQVWEQDFSELRRISVKDEYIAFTLGHGYQIFKIVGK